eukprot:gnl/MRDRNA2_/MRDRNA2_93094_c0_seq1.p1 gnl/MRDRNA2_/MRDRNA2_93094_c0~~gnl/MRDRNA2_/MRDRNA2_93094_c0_seq1.p1  ORF type:complete len:302 (+),score=97.27 gnl/MRDRNA2_/MRDRNA2_93094_c0_seq1:79-984(+)
MFSSAMSLLALLSVNCASCMAVSLTLETQDFKAAEVADQNFLAMQWRALESDMLRLQQHLISETHSRGFLQLHTSPVAHAKNQSANLELKEKPKAEKKMEPKKASGKIVPSNPAEPKLDRLAAAEGMMKGLTGKAMLAPMLGMLKSMYDDEKKRIGELNKKEAESKERFAKQQAEFNAKTKSIKDRHDAHKLNDEFFHNETVDANRAFKYWEGVRSRNHRQFHNALKITHGMMQRMKEMISKYEAAMTMKTEDKKPAAPVEAPEVVLLQQREAVATFIKQQLPVVRQNLAEILETDPPLKL